ncbi:hypothetical protein AVEN_98531-1 [Araneus ventricosus]|uniref:Uncharacterized protein n=1 Tax=Araneus ventricosus TaxID=182803 RepID=A0A4Y2K5I8_ARAVE|nr:hypothetical protein AVEN_98531-1 [Araneus ventricosus]
MKQILHETSVDSDMDPLIYVGNGHGKIARMLPSQWNAAVSSCVLTNGQKLFEHPYNLVQLCDCMMNAIPTLKYRSIRLTHKSPFYIFISEEMKISHVRDYQ